MNKFHHIIHVNRACTLPGPSRRPIGRSRSYRRDLVSEKSVPRAPEKSLVETCWRYVMLLSIPKNEGNRTVRRLSDEIMMFPCVPQN